MAQGVPGSLRPRIFLTFGTTRVVGRQPYAPAAFTLGEIPGTHFLGLSRPQGIWFRREPWKKSPVTSPGIDLGTVRLVAQCLNHYATPGPQLYCTFISIYYTCILSNVNQNSYSFINFLNTGFWDCVSFKMTYRIFSNLIRTSFCQFLKRKKKLVRGFNPHLSFNRPLPTRQTD